MLRAPDKWTHNKHTTRTGHTQPASGSLDRFPLQHHSLCPAPGTPRAEPQTFTTPSHTQPTRRTACPSLCPAGTSTGSASTLQQHSAVFPSHWHRESLERHWKELVSSCGWNMGRRNEADVFSFGSGLDPILQPRSCRISPVSVLIHLDNGGLVLRA